MAERKVCAIDGCGKPARRRGWCGKHYQRWYKHGDPTISRNAIGERPATCTVEECGRKHHAHGFCETHAYRFRTHGDPLGGNEPNPEAGVPRKWLEDRVGFDGPDCLIWPFGDALKVDGVNWRASRYMCFLAHGEPPSPELHAAHACGRGEQGCVHPQHLRWATAAENEADKLLHGTRAMGEDVHLAKLTEQQVREIRALHGKLTQWEIAHRYGVSQAAIWSILARQTWKHVS